MTSHIDQALKQLDTYIKTHGFTNLSIYLTAIIVSSSIIYGFFYISECGFEPNLYYGFSDYIDAFTLKAACILTIVLTILYSTLFLLGLIPWSILPAYTQHKSETYHTVLIFALILASNAYSSHISSHLKESSDLNFVTNIISLSGLFMMMVSQSIRSKAILRSVFIVSIIITVSIHYAISDAKEAKHNAKQYHIEYVGGKKEEVFLLASSRNYLLCQSISNPTKTSAIHTRYIKKVTPVINDFANKTLALPPSENTRAGDIHDPK